MQEQCTTLEVWRPIPGYEGLYDVSDHGRLRSWLTRNPCGKRREEEPVVLAQTQKGCEYNRVELRGNGKKNYCRVHMLVLAAFVGPRPEGHEGAHWNGDSRDNRLSNLRWATHAENEADKRRHGRTACGDRHGLRKHPERRAFGARNGAYTHPERLPRGNFNGSRLHPEKLARGKRHGANTHPECWRRGEQHHASNLTEAAVREIRGIYAAGGISHRALGAKYGVGPSAVADIVHHRTWKHIDD